MGRHARRPSSKDPDRDCIFSNKNSPSDFAAELEQNFECPARWLLPMGRSGSLSFLPAAQAEAPRTHTDLGKGAVNLRLLPDTCINARKAEEPAKTLENPRETLGACNKRTETGRKGPFPPLGELLRNCGKKRLCMAWSRTAEPATLVTKGHGARRRQQLLVERSGETSGSSLRSLVELQTNQQRAKWLHSLVLTLREEQTQ